MKVKSIEWGSAYPPNEVCSYNHVYGKTGIHKYLITWKGWKESLSYGVEIDNTGDWLGSENSLDDAKGLAQAYFEECIFQCVEVDHEG